MDIISVYNPANSNITADEIAAMKDLSNEEIAQLATAYPNSPNGNAYLVYYNAKEELKDQRYPLGTWANLNNLRKLGQKWILPFNFRSKQYPSKAVGNVLKSIPPRTVDLSKDDLGTVEGLKPADKVSAPEATGSLVTSIPVTNEVAQADAPVDPKLKELEDSLQQARDDKAHHMTIKSIEKSIEDYKNNSAK
jgi:hypothetical protein